MSEDLKNYFSFSRRERRGIIALIILIILIFTGSYLLRHFNKTEEIDITEFENQLDRLITTKDTAVYHIETDGEVFTYKTPAPINPNTASEEQWHSIGITSAQYRVINNYHQKGGRFKTKEELKKIYSITPEDYNKIEPYLFIPPEDRPPTTTPPPFTHERVTERSSATLIIELNTADTTLLQALPGIGPAFASRIVRYRNLLGGFHNKDQLKEVFGMDEERLSGFENNITINPAYIKRLEINDATSFELQQHPYIDKQLSLLIVSYRNQHGRFRNTDDFKKLALVNDEIASRLQPYLSFD